MEDTNDESEMFSDNHATNIIRNVHEAISMWQDDSTNSIVLDDFSFSQKFIENDAQYKDQNLLKFVADSN